MRNRPGSRRRAAFTLIELMIALVLVALIAGNVYSVMGGTSRALGERNAEFEADVQAQRTLDRISMALVGSYEKSLYFTQESPGSQSTLHYQESLGMQDVDGNGIPEMVLGDPMQIGLTSKTGGDVAWSQNPGSPEQTRVVWAKHVPGFAAGELPNGIDDNGNGLIDEAGLAFVKEGRSVRILLTLRRPDGRGGIIERHLETTVTCRN